MAYARTEWVGAAVATTLSSGIDNSTLSASIAASTGWPTGGTGKWTIVIDRGTASEEQCEVTSRSSLTLTLSSRGFNGTTAASHSSGATVEVIAGKRDYDEANYAVSQTVGAIAAKGDLLLGSAANTLSKLAVGTNGYGLYADSTQTTGARWGLADPGGSAYTPTLTQSGAVTKTVTYANYTANGKLVHWNIILTLTGSGTVANAVTVGLPVASRSGASQVVGNGVYYDVSTTTVYNVMALASSGASTCILLSSQAGGISGWGVAPSLAAASGDIIYLQGHYWST